MYRHLQPYNPPEASVNRDLPIFSLTANLLIRIRFAPSYKGRWLLRLGSSFASDDARPSDYFAHETPNPTDGQITQLAANAYKCPRFSNTLTYWVLLRFVESISPT